MINIQKAKRGKRIGLHKSIYGLYSPDFNPIEQYWSFLKNKLKKLALYCLDFFKNLNEVLRIKYVKVDG